MLLHPVGQVIFWLSHLFFGITASSLLLGQMADEAREENRSGDEFVYSSLGRICVFGLIFAALTGLAALPGFFWGSKWALVTLIPTALAVVFQLTANADRCGPCIAVAIESGLSGFVLSGATLVPLHLPNTAIFMAVVAVVVSVSLMVLGIFSEEE